MRRQADDAIHIVFSGGNIIGQMFQTNNAVNVEMHRKRSRVQIAISQVSGGSRSTVTQHCPSGAEGDTTGWWTFGRKVWATE